MSDRITYDDGQVPRCGSEADWRRDAAICALHRGHDGSHAAPFLVTAYEYDETTTAEPTVATLTWSQVGQGTGMGER